MLLHILNEEKFVDLAIHQLERAEPGNNIYLILIFERRSTARFLKSEHKSIILVYYKDFERQLEIINGLNFNAVVVHYLSYEKARLVNSLKNKRNDMKIAWVFWGGDGFALQKLENNLYQSKTAKIRLPGIKKFIRYQQAWVYRMFADKGIYIKDLYKSNRTKIKAITQNIDFIMPVVPGDYYKLAAAYPTAAKYVDWNYSTMETIMDNNLDLKVTGQNILIGNSSTDTSNHIEIIDKLSLLNIDNKKVVVPLSYGDPIYRDFIIRYGKEKLGDKFFPIVDYLPLSEYNDILASCGFVIMNHNRQQAGANIISCLWMGAKLFLNKETTFYEYLKDIDIDFETIDNINENSFEILDEAMVAHNRKMLYKHWGQDEMLKKTRHLFHILED